MRIAGIDIPDDKRGEIALTYIFGIGKSSSQKILKNYGNLSVIYNLYVTKSLVPRWDNPVNKG